MSIFTDLAAQKTSEVLACSPVKIVNVVDFGSLTTLAKNVKIEYRPLVVTASIISLFYTFNLAASYNSTDGCQS